MLDKDLKLDDLKIGSMIRWDWSRTSKKRQCMYGILTRIHKRDKHRDEYVMHLFNGDQDFEMMFYREQLEDTKGVLSIVRL